MSCSFSCGIVRLNVGGRYFATTKQTLIKDPQSLLARCCLVEERPQGYFVEEPSGALFIDRNPRCFEHVLDYLRDGTYSCSPDELGSLLREARFFQLSGLVKRVQCDIEATARASGDSAPPSYHNATAGAAAGSKAGEQVQMQIAVQTLDMLRRIEASSRAIHNFCSSILIGTDGYLHVKRY